MGTWIIDEHSTSHDSAAPSAFGSPSEHHLLMHMALLSLDLDVAISSTVSMCSTKHLLKIAWVHEWSWHVQCLSRLASLQAALICLGCPPSVPDCCHASITASLCWEGLTAELPNLIMPSWHFCRCWAKAATCHVWPPSRLPQGLSSLSSQPGLNAPAFLRHTPTVAVAAAAANSRFQTH